LARRSPGWDSARQNNVGIVYKFNATTGRRLLTIDNPDVVGARFDNAVGQDAGSAYLFDLRAGDPLEMFVDSAAVGGEHCGEAVGWAGDLGCVAGGGYSHIAAAGGGAEHLFQEADGPEISVHGNGWSIRDGDTIPGSMDSTAFGRVGVGSSSTKDLTIWNIGSERLNLTGIPLVELVPGK
jgi:hypothetical protein